MKVIIYTNQKGKAVVTVEGQGKESPKTVAKAYKATMAELNNKEEK